MYKSISQRHALFRRLSTRKKAPFGIKRVIIFFIIISLIVMVAASVIFLF